MSKEKQEKKIQEYMILYPPFESKKEEKKLKSQINLQLQSIKLEEEDDEKYEINETFLEIVLKKPFSFGRNRIINTVSKNIQQSKLPTKLLEDYRSDKKINSVNLCNLFAHNLNYSKLYEKEILYRIGENDNRLFYILSGRIQVLKPKELTCMKMTTLEYLKYCKYLHKNNEIYLLNEVINSNSQVLPLISTDDVALISRLYFIDELSEKIEKRMISNNTDLIKFFHLWHFSFDDFNIITSEINSIERKKQGKILGAEQEWEDYINERCCPSEGEFHFYEPFKRLLKQKQIRFITCFVYQSESYLEPGDYFGDLSYESNIRENKFTIRAQKDSVLAWIKNNDYLNVIDPKRKMETIKEISFLHNYFFFKEIGLPYFEKNYYEYFSVHTYTRGNVIYSTGDKPKDLIFIRKGKLSFEIKCSVIDLFFLVKDLFNNLITNSIFNYISKNKKKKLLSKETINILRKSAYDNRLKKLLRKNPKFFDELKKAKKFQISEINGHEIIGIEEIFLNVPYIMKCTVNDNRAVCYNFPIDNISQIIKDGKGILFSYIQTAVNKIISLIKRLDTIKNNSLHLEKMKFDYDFKINQLEDKKNIKELNLTSNFYNNNNALSVNDNNNNLNNTAEEIQNNTNNLINIDTSEQKSNRSNSFYREKSPIKKSLLSNFFNNNLKEAIVLHKKFNKTNNFSHSNSKNISINETGSTIYRQSLFKLNDNFILNKNENENKNKKEINNESNTKIFFENINNKKENFLLLGKNKINIDNIKKNIDEFLSCDNSDKYVEIIQSNKVNNNYITNFYNHNVKKENSYAERANLFRKKNFRLSLVPLNNLNIYTDNNKSIEEKKYKNGNNNSKSMTDFVGVNSTDSYLPSQNNDSNNFLPKINLKLGITKKKNFSSNKIRLTKYKNNRNKTESLEFKKINKREVGKEIIKDYYKDIKMKGYASFIPNKEMNTVFMRKFNKKYKDAIKVKK